MNLHINHSAVPNNQLCEVMKRVIDQSPVTVCVTDADGTIQYANRHLTALTGYEPYEVIGQKAAIFTGGQTDAAMDNDLWGTLKRGEEWRGQIQNRKKNGDLFWEDLHIAPVVDSYNTITHFVAFSEDITERLAMEQAVSEEEALFLTTFEQAAVGIAHIALDGYFLVINQNFCDLLGYTREEMLSTDLQSVTHPDDLASVLNHLQRMLTGEISTYTIEKRYIRKDKTIQWVQITVSMVLDHTEKPCYFISVAQDITQRKFAFDALEQANSELERLRLALALQNEVLENTAHKRGQQLSYLHDHMSAILDNTSDAILVVNADNQVDTANAAFESMFGYQHRDIESQSILMVCHGDKRSDFLDAIACTRETNQGQRIQLLAQRQDGSTFEVDIALAPVKNYEGRIICSIRDITHLKAVERSKDEFYTMVSHELRGPLASIMLSSETMQLHYDKLSDEKKIQKLQHIYQQGRNLNELVTAILDTARFSAGTCVENTPVDLGEMLERILHEVLPNAHARNQVLTHTAVPQAPFVMADPANMARVWRNLLGNAIKYSGEGSQINVSLYNSTRLEESDVSSEVRHMVPAEVLQQPYMVAMVQDNGPGIDESDLPRLFTRFFRGWAGKTDIPGTGLGLSLVRDMLVCHGGNITVRSAMGAGATFCFWLPALTV